MPTRTRAAAALAMRPNSDAEMEDEQELIDVGEEEAESGADVEESEEGEDAINDSDDDQDEIQSDEEPENEVEEDEELSSAAPRLKIKLKLPTQPVLSSGNATPVRGVGSSPTKSRRYRPIGAWLTGQDPISHFIQQIVPESEEETGEGASSDVSEEVPVTSRSATGTPSYGTRPMTTRQAVLASVVGSHHVSLDEGSRSKKQPLNETELALRREETARKRKNITEKKLEDEKAETINRLLKRQSRPRNRRTNADTAPQEVGEDGEGDEAAEGVPLANEEVIKPVMYRWLSTSRVPAINAESATDKRMAITFSVPTIVEIPSVSDKGDLPIPAPAICAVEGCGAARKYKLVRNSALGACGMPHLKVLEERKGTTK
ncbi:hypothetical protein M378DRAFT_1041110 [Amanita muscaria Koide BX008]|uniref:INO80 complex subunit B-like conserved region domain-containing protein n=1 Tax=Amanita muscaria (strain Koide BX008) TaxID=946122 RepID=A0A0C2TD85_AMAMK|nr:hypothetical protein M378DRAFT_1041110 [Amanita muscaria Koide BX008]